MMVLYSVLVNSNRHLFVPGNSTDRTTKSSGYLHALVGQNNKTMVNTMLLRQTNYCFRII